MASRSTTAWPRPVSKPARLRSPALFGTTQSASRAASRGRPRCPPKRGSTSPSCCRLHPLPPWKAASPWKRPPRLEALTNQPLLTDLLKSGVSLLCLIIVDRSRSLDNREGSVVAVEPQPEATHCTHSCSNPRRSGRTDRTTAPQPTARIVEAWSARGRIRTSDTGIFKRPRSTPSSEEKPRSEAPHCCTFVADRRENAAAFAHPDSQAAAEAATAPAGGPCVLDRPAPPDPTSHGRPLLSNVFSPQSLR